MERSSDAARIQANVTTLEKAQLLADMAENARVAGDTAASIELAIDSFIQVSLPIN